MVTRCRGSDVSCLTQCSWDKKEGCFQVWLLTPAGVSHHVCWGADQSGSVHEERPTWRQGRVDDVWSLRGWTAGWDRHLETYLSRSLTHLGTWLSLWHTLAPLSLSLTHMDTCLPLSDTPDKCSGYLRDSPLLPDCCCCCCSRASVTPQRESPGAGSAVV